LRVGLNRLCLVALALIIVFLDNFVVRDGLVANIGEVEGNLLFSPLNYVIVRFDARILYFANELRVVVKVNDVRDSGKEKD